jgi:hypothetical protein
VTKKRFLLIVSLPLTAVVVLVGVVALLPPDDRPGVTKANFDRIQEGMTLAEVEEIFGSDRRGSLEAVSYLIHEEAGWDDWLLDDGSNLSIRFVDNRVAGKRWLPSNERFFDKIRRWLHLR